MKAGYKNPYCRMISILMTVILVAMLTRVNTYAESSSYSIEVNITENVVTVFENGQPVKAMTCSSGSASPHSGTYRTSAKYRWLTLVGNVYGQYCTRITGHILFHSVPYTSYGNASSLEYWEYDKLGTSASLGRIRLSVEDAKWIYDNCALSTSVTFVTSGSLPLGSRLHIRSRMHRKVSGSGIRQIRMGIIHGGSAENPVYFRQNIMPIDMKN